MTRPRVLIGLVLLAAVLALVIWRFRGNTDELASPAGTTKRDRAAVPAHPLGVVDSTAGAPHWLGQPGVGPRRIAGVVLHEGAPVPNAVVRLASKQTMAGMYAQPKVISDAAGRFDFGEQIALQYIVAAEAPSLTTAVESVDLRDPGVKSNDLHLLLYPCDASIHGTIRDTADGVVPGARVSMAASELVIGGGTEAKSDGSYELCVPVGSSAIAVSADGYAQVSDGISVFGRMRRDFSLMPAITVRGRVIRERDRAPVAGALVQLESENGSSNSFLPLTAISSADGEFTIEGGAPGRHVLTATAERLASARPVGIIGEIGRPLESVVVPLSSTLQVSGTVVERGTQTPVAGTSVSLWQRSARDRQRELRATSQRDGSFVIEYVTAGAYEILLETSPRSDELPPSVTVATTDVTGLVLQVERLASISGRVTHRGKPVAGTRLNASQMTHTTADHTGHYTLRVTPGTYQIYAESQRVGVFTSGPFVTVAKSESKANVDIEMDLSASITGTVLDQNEAPVAGVTLRFSLLRGRDFGQATTADDGTFSARALSGGGDYVYEVQQGDTGSLTLPPLSGKRHPPIAVRDGQTQVTGVQIKVRRERLAIAGRVVDASGRPVADVSVTATPEKRYARELSVTTTEAGTFTIRDLPAGTYSVRASAPRGHARELSVAAGRSDLVLKLPGLGGIDGTLAGFADAPELYVVSEGVGRIRPTVTADSFQARDIPAGTYDVAAYGDSGVDVAQVTVTPGAIAKITLRPRGRGSIAGTVLNKTTRAPMPGLDCAYYTETDRWAPESRLPAVTDAKGAYRIDRVISGEVHVACDSKEAHVSGRTTVIANQTARLDLDAVVYSTNEETFDLGFELELQLQEIMVKSVAPGGIAARSGLAVGDVIIEIDDHSIGPYDSHIVGMLDAKLMRPPIKLDIERADKPLTITLSAKP